MHVLIKTLKVLFHTRIFTKNNAILALLCVMGPYVPACF